MEIVNIKTQKMEIQEDLDSSLQKIKDLESKLNLQTIQNKEN